MKESSIHTLISGGFPRECILDRVENVANVGMPDCNGAYQGVEFWLEYKMVGAKSVKTTVEIAFWYKDKKESVWLRPEQNVWHVRRKRAGTKSYVLARDKDTLHLFGLNDDYIWQYLYATTKPFNYKTLLGLILE